MTFLSGPKERIVVLGSGWAGYALAKTISPSQASRILISPRSHFVFTPLIASTAVGTLEFRAAVEPCRKLDLTEFHQAWASDIDFSNKTITVEANQRDGVTARSGKDLLKGLEFQVPYDRLVVAVGCYSQTFGVEGVKEHACFLRDATDARTVRLRVLQKFEQAALPSTSAAQRKRLLHFAVVGGGPTGIEFAAELHDLVHEDLAKLYPELMSHVAITIYDIAPKVLPMFDRNLAAYATNIFSRAGIRVKTEHHLQGIRRDDDVLLMRIKEEPEEVAAGVVVWSTGLMQNPLVGRLVGREIAGMGKIAKNCKTGGFAVDSHLRVQVESQDSNGKQVTKTLPDVYAIGDCANIQGESLPATAQVASQQATYLGKRFNAGTSSQGAPTAPFHFRNWGTMAYLGGWRAIHQKGADELKGRAAWILWRTAYLTKSMSLKNKLMIPFYCPQLADPITITINMIKQSANYGLYLVTDSTPDILGDRNLEQVVEASLRGGVTILQYRDKHSERSAAVVTAKKLHAIARRYNVPLLINDRVDIAAEIDCEGVHIGQDDMAYEEARKLLGPNKIIGVTASSKEEALKACEAGADYLGIGTVYSTQTKKDTKSIIGPSGVRDILSALHDAGHSSVPTVCIGGINASNTAPVLAAAASPFKSLDGVAVVSALIAAPDPAAAACDLLGKVIVAKIPEVIRAVADKTPLSHNMTNLVVQNFAANVALCVGASPIMANYAEEAADLAKLGGALVVNMGTVTPDGLKNYLQAIKAYNEAGRPIVIDPVGAGATAVRRNAVKTLLDAGHFTIIKGNEGEIQTVAGATITQRGVDSTSSLTFTQKASLVRSIALSRRNVVILTGAVDLVSDGARTLAISNGHSYLGEVTGTGCTLGTTVSAMVAAYSADPFLAAVAGTVMFGLAAELAAERSEVRGPGSFVPAFLDELYGIRKSTADGDLRWVSMAKVKAVEVNPDDAWVN
ncbi:NADH dehydrogenase [Fusarium austroafricanum]|uniref:NADH dehydrogenase n=1 Tax=Fusarium austroafricanum TaxID=2364996 RepID=A0A8H4KWM8_9HYPO|nr:NADH dehydrogenase [Fusarium austroafricanum]